VGRVESPASGVRAPCRRKTRYGLAVLSAKARGPFVSIAELVLLRSRVVSWSLPFEQPIPVPGGRQLKTLRDAIEHLSETVPKSEHDHAKVQHAAACLAGAAEGRDFVMHARIAVIQALKRNETPPPFLETGKQSHWGKRKLKRDQ